ncbi:hypothetical protein E9536_16095 [Burkholderia sp. LS-044]|nr:hypothetical protein E9536_16095 [Burkholderia sp. LS-044]
MFDGRGRLLGARGSGLGARGSGLGARGSGLGARGSASRKDRECGRCRPPAAYPVGRKCHLSACQRIQPGMTGLINVVVIGAKPHARYSARAAVL